MSATPDIASKATEPETPLEQLLADPRIQPDSYVVYPTDYEAIPYEDRHSWALTVTDGHAFGWAIRPGLGASGSRMALNEQGLHVIESRDPEENRSRRWPLVEALRIALAVVDTHKVAGMSATEAIAQGRADNQSEET